MSRDNILIVSPEDDTHAQVIAKTVEDHYEHRAIVWDSRNFPQLDRINMRVGNESQEYTLRTPTDRIDISSIRSVWWRRPKRHNIAKTVTEPDVRSYCERESAHCFRGMLLSAGIPLINDPIVESAADLKPYQLNIASLVGLSVPNTLMSNDPEEIKKFYNKFDKNRIYKAFTAPTWKMIETRLLEQDDLQNLEKLQHGPIIVQEKIEKKNDIRVTVVDSKAFAAKVETSREEAALDWRLDLSCWWEPYKLPDSVTADLIELVDRLGLRYGCIDLRQTPDDEYVFLEINPSGQFLFIEIDTGLPISRSFAKLLSDPVGQNNFSRIQATTKSS